MNSLSDSARLHLLTPPAGRVRVVLDTDTYNEIDDQFAVVQMMLSPERLSVEAIYAAPFLNDRAASPGAGMQASYEEILRILDRIGVSGEELAWRGVTDYVGLDRRAQDAPAVDHLIERARVEADSPLYVIAIGAISNIASALIKAPDIAGKMVVIWLGGNALDWPREFVADASFNLKQDIGGAQVLLDSGVPLVLVPAMGVTSHLISNVPEIEKYVEPHGEIGAFLAARFKAYSTDHDGWSKEIWDMAAVAWLLQADWTPSFLMPTPILTDEIDWIREESRPAMRYVRHVDRDAILRDFFSKLERFAAGTLKPAG